MLSEEPNNTTHDSLPWGPRDGQPENYPDRHYLSLGVLHIPVAYGMMLIPAWDLQKRLHSVGVGIASQLMELTLFAAPKSPGLWEKTINSLVATGTREGYIPFPLHGQWGRELLLRPGNNTHHMTRRFLGVEKPGWLLRATLFGDAAEKSDTYAAMCEILEQVLINRDTNPHPPGEILYLTPLEGMETS